MPKVANPSPKKKNSLTSSPSKSSLQKTPSKANVTKSNGLTNGTPKRNAIKVEPVSGRKRRVQPDESDAEMATPTRKKRRGLSRAPSETPTDVTKRGSGRLVHSLVKTLSDASLLSPEHLNNVPSLPVPLPSRPSNTLFIFGNGDMGQLGLGTTNLDEIPRPVLHEWFEAARNDKSHVLGAKKGAGIVKVAPGGMHTLAIDENGKIWTWGINDHGSIGRPTFGVPNPSNPKEMIEPEELETHPTPLKNLFDEGFKAVEVAAGASISAALGSDGTIRAWGAFLSSEGLLGFDEHVSEICPAAQFSPTTITAFAKPKLAIHRNLQFSQIVAGHDHILALTTTGRVYTWGNGQQAQLGRKIIERRKFSGLTPERLAIKDIVRIATGNYHSFAIDKGGAVWGWGLNNYGQVGIRWVGSYANPVSDNENGHKVGKNGIELVSGYASDGLENSPESPTKSKKHSTNHISRHASLSDDEDGIVWAPSIIGSLLPESLGRGRKVVDIAAGEHHSLFLLNDGSVWACGRADGFELGIATDHPEYIKLQERIAAEQERIQRIQEAENLRESGHQNKINGVHSDHAVASTLINGDATTYIQTPLDEFIPYPIPLLFPPAPTTSSPDPPIEAYTPLAHTQAIGQRIKQISCGMHSNLAVTEDGWAYSWGYGENCELGRGNEKGDTVQRVPGRIWSQELDGGGGGDSDAKEMGRWKVSSAHAGGQHCLLISKWERGDVQNGNLNGQNRKKK